MSEQIARYQAQLATLGGGGGGALDPAKQKELEEKERTEQGWKGLLFERLKAMLGGSVMG